MDSKDKAAKARARFDATVKKVSVNPEFAAVSVGRVVMHLLKAGTPLSDDALIEALKAAADGNLKQVLAADLATGALTIIGQARPELAS